MLNFKEPHQVVNGTHKSDTSEEHCALWSITVHYGLQNQEWEGEFQGRKDDSINFQFQKMPREFDRRI